MTTVIDLSRNSRFLDKPVDAGVALLDGVDVDHTSPGYRLSGLRTVSAWAADFGGGTAKIQQRAPGGTWIDVADGSFTANGSINLLFGGENEIRGVLTGSSGADSVFLKIGGKLRR